MKKKLFAIGLFLGMCAHLFAQDFDAQIQAAVDEMVAGLRLPVEVVIEPVRLANTDITSGFSRYLHGKVEYSAAKNSKFSVKQKSRGMKQARIEGSYQQFGNSVDVTLKLLSDTDKTLGTSSFKIPVSDLEKFNIEWMPGNMKTEAAVKEQEKNLDTVLSQLVQNTASQPVNTVLAAQNSKPAFTLDAWPDSESFTYADGDSMKINLYSDKDCYFKIYYIDSQNNQQLIYPNPANSNNFLRANTLRTIPDDTEYIMGAPYGMESILVIASDAPLPYSESEMMPVDIKQTRGMSQTKAQNVNGNTAKNVNGIIVQKRFNYTVVAKNNTTETISYNKPDDMRKTINEMRASIQAAGGSFSGDENSGTFKASGISGSYDIKNAVAVLILEKPFVIPNSMIENEVKKFFGVK